MASSLLCHCGCSELSKKRIREIMEKTDQIRTFVKDTDAVNMFLNYIDKGSNQSNAKDYIIIIQHALQLLSGTSNITYEELGDQIVYDLAYELENAETDEIRKLVLEKVIDRYDVKLQEKSEFQQFKEYLRDKYVSKSERLK